MPAPASICLVRLSALGDVVMVLPLVRHLRRQWPSTRLTWICGKAVLPLLSGLAEEGIELLPIEKPRAVTDYLRLRRDWSARSWDVLLCLQASWRANWLYPCLQAKRKIGFGADRAKDLHRFFVGEGLPPAAPHLVGGFLQFAEALGLPAPSAVEWGLPVAPEARSAVAPLLPRRPFVAINACTSKPERDAPPSLYAEVALHLDRIHNLDTVLIGGPSERERAVAAAVVAGAPQVVNLVGRTRLPEMVALLESSRMLVSPDTGAVHIANALGRPVVGLYAVAPADRTGPFGQEGRCVDVFDEALAKFLGRRRSECPWAQRVHHPGAMGLITFPRVREKIDVVLSAGRA